MGFDLIGRRRITSKSSKKGPIVISSEHGTFENTEAYIESMTPHTETIRYGANNATWHFLWGYVKLVAQEVAGEDRCLATEEDLRLGSSYHGHFFSKEKAISIAKCCLKGKEIGLYDNHVRTQLGKEPEEWYNLLNHFTNFCLNSDGFSVH